jgi:hypothetical protein
MNSKRSKSNISAMIVFMLFMIIMVGSLLFLTSSGASQRILSVAQEGGIATTTVSYPTCPPDSPSGDIPSTSGNCVSPYTREGTTISEWTSTTATDLYRLTGYRLEEVLLPGIISCRVDAPDSSGRVREQTFTVDKVWRFTISSERPYHQTALPWFLWLDNKIVGLAQQNALVQGRIVVLVYDRELIKEGATIGISYSSNTKPEETLSSKLNIGPIP